MSVLQPQESGYVIGIGSNIEPEVNVPRILLELLDRFGEVYMSRILRTHPVDMASDNEFLNLAVFLRSDLRPDAVKDVCNEIECALGRDREDPERAKKDRVADLDILFPLNPSDSVAPLELVEGAYFRPGVADLYGLLGLLAPQWAEPGEAVRMSGQSVGKMPATIHLDRRTGHVVIIEHSP